MAISGTRLAGHLIAGDDGTVMIIHDRSGRADVYPWAPLKGPVLVIKLLRPRRRALELTGTRSGTGTYLHRARGSHRGQGMDGLGNRRDVEHLVEAARPTERAMADAAARDAIRAAVRRTGARGSWPRIPAEVTISTRDLCIAAAVVLALVFMP